MATSTSKSKSGAAKAPGKPRQPGVERRRNHPLRAKDGLQTLILLQNVPHLGKTGEVVKVRPGFARNYLVPQGLAIFATPHNLRIVEQHKRRAREMEAARRSELSSLAAQLNQKSITIEANANPEGYLYGSVNSDQIATVLRSANFNISEEMVRIDGPLKELGQYTIKLALGMDIESEINLWVVPAHTE
ncbi:MAG: 50S ribosomal protein L9 [bacterium]